MSIERSSGVLLPISSLPSNYGIGTLGKEAYAFVDFLVRAKQSYWQILPIGPTNYGDSPYASFSAYAGNPYFIDLDLLVKEKLLKKSEIGHLKNEPKIDYGDLYNTRFDILAIACKRGLESQKEAFEAFIEENKNWLDKYSLFMALKKKFAMASWQQWPDEDLRLCQEDACNQARDELKEDIKFFEFIQYLFFKQYLALKKYANEKGIRIIGDLPIYIALDSAEAWADHDQFLFNEYHKPTEVSGVPPDYFSEDGQLWGTPLYNWDLMKQQGYKWWIDRVGQTSKFFDVIRIDHFRGFQQYWSIPFGDDNARNGHWVDGPSLGFVSVLRDWFCNVDFIAEDLGELSEDVNQLVKDSTFPGMRVLQFGMDEDGSSTHCPHHYNGNCVCYVGTHDNQPIMGWWAEASAKEKKFATALYGLNKEEGINIGFIRAGMGSIAKLFVCTLQDLLGYGKEATINTPGTLGNWTWRIDKEALNNETAKKLAEMTYRSYRLPKSK